VNFIQDIFICAQSGNRRTTAHSGHCSQPNRCDANSLTEVRKLGRWRTRLSLIFLLCSLGLAIAGCGGSSNAVGPIQAGNLAILPNTVKFGSVPVGQTAFSSVSLTNQGSTATTVSQVTVTGTPFSVVGTGDLPISVAPGSTFNFYVYFSPYSRQSTTAKLMIASDATESGSTAIDVSGTGTTASTSTELSGVVCGSASMTGAGTDNCTVTLNTAAPSGGQSVTLVSNNVAVTVPASVTVPAGSTTLGFTATATSVSAPQTVTLTASSGGVSEAFNLQLNAMTGTPSAPSALVPTGFVCGSASLTGAEPDNCFVTVNGAAPSGGTVVSLSSNNAAVTVPATVTVPSGATTVGFTATATSVSTSQTATLTASANGASQTYSLQLNASSSAPAAPAVPVLSGLVCGNSSLSGGQADNCTVTLNGTASSGGTTVAITSNNAALTVPSTIMVPSGATTAGFTATSSSVSTTQMAMLTASASGASQTYSLQLNASSSAPNAPAAPVLSGLVCGSTSMTGAGKENCTVTLNGAATSGGVAVGLSSNDGALTVPATVTVAAGATSAGFTAAVASVSTTQTATLTASASGVSQNFSVQLNASQSGSSGATLSIGSTSVNFGNVTLNAPATQSITLTSTGTAAVTVSAATVSGTGFTLSGGSLPISLSSGQTATLNVQFDPTVAGAAAGTLTIASTSSANPSQVVSLSGTGIGSSYQVNLTWNAPTSSSDPIAGYSVYRSPSGASSYAQLNSSVITQTSFTDPTVQNGQSYDYIVESVDSSGVTSAPSDKATASVP
jgi:hypothetical protein